MFGRDKPLLGMLQVPVPHYSRLSQVASRHVTVIILASYSGISLCYFFAKDKHSSPLKKFFFLLRTIPSGLAHFLPKYFLPVYSTSLLFEFF
jgi:hypothetical protein